MNEIVLSGCPSASLSSYLKALAILRLVAEQADSSVRGFWKAGYFTLVSQLSNTDLRRFFLDRYKPTPIISPWSGRAGFLEGEDGASSTRKGVVILCTVSQSSGSRFADYRKIIESVRHVSVITRLDGVRAEVKELEKLKKAHELDEKDAEKLTIKKKEEKTLKDNLLFALRAELDDAFLPWIDACFALSGNEGKAAPLLGSGGNEGSMDFSINHVGLLLDLIDRDSDAPTPLAAVLIDNALFGSTQVLESKSNLGFLSTSATGGPNMSTGFDGPSKENVWNSVLVLEGSLLFASVATRRLESDEKAGLSFPFMVMSTRAGHGSIGSNESARPELWLPLWNMPTTVQEVRALISEGRNTFGKRQVKNGLDMLQALSDLGVNRGISAFDRYGFFERRGQGYYVATCMGEYPVAVEKQESSIYHDLNKNDWLFRFGRFAQGENVAKRFLTLRRRLEDALFELSGRTPTPAETQSLIVLLGEIQSAMASSKKAVELLRPIPQLSENWMAAADDGTPVFRIACALAGLHGLKDKPLPLRAQLFPLHPKFDQWMTPEAGYSVRIHTARKGRLVETLNALLARRLWLAEQFEMTDKPLSSPAGVMVGDITAFLRDGSMDERIAALLLGLCLCDIPQDIERGAGDGAAPAAYSLLKLCLTPDRILRNQGWLGEGDHLPVPPDMLAQLIAGNHGNRAVQASWRRLRASGVTPLFGHDVLPDLGGVAPRRVAAALLIPLRYGATGVLARSVLKTPKAETETV